MESSRDEHIARKANSVWGPWTGWPLNQNSEPKFLLNRTCLWDFCVVSGIAPVHLMSLRNDANASFPNMLLPLVGGTGNQSDTLALPRNDTSLSLLGNMSTLGVVPISPNQYSSNCTYSGFVRGGMGRHSSQTKACEPELASLDFGLDSGCGHP